MFSNRTSWSLEKNPLICLFEELKTKKCEVFDLTVSNPTQCSIEYPKQAILKPLLNDQNFFYDPVSFGNLDARKVISSDYKNRGLSVDLKNIILTSSTSEAYSFLFRLLLNPNEHVLLPRPSYPLFEFLANLNDVKIDFYPIVYDGQWKIDCDALEELVQETTKAIVLVNPNNPTGSFVKPEELKRLNEICKKHQLVLICDEVFLDYGFKENPASFFSLCSNKEVLTFVLGGLSKAMGLPQMKVSWILTSGPQQLTEEALNRLEVVADTYLSVSTPSQNALSQWFDVKVDIQQVIKQRINQNREILNNVFASEPETYQMLRADGGWYAIVKILKDVKEEFAYDLLKEKQVFVHPGYFFDFEDDSHIVLSLLPEREIFEQGLKRIVAYLEARNT